MRLLILSDIHANLEALEACLSFAPEYDLLLNLGDSVGYGASPAEVLKRLRPLGGVMVRGNHDKVVSGAGGMENFNPAAATSVEWSRHQLAEPERRWLKRWPQGPVAVPGAESIQLVHGSPLHEDGYISSHRAARQVFNATTARITFFGHTHIQAGFGLGAGQIVEFSFPHKKKIPATHKVRFAKGMRYLINPGSVGQPRDNDPRAAFAFFDTESDILSYHRVPYDIPLAQTRIVSAGLPPHLAMRLAEGH